MPIEESPLDSVVEKSVEAVNEDWSNERVEELRSLLNVASDSNQNRDERLKAIDDIRAKENIPAYLRNEIFDKMSGMMKDVSENHLIRTESLGCIERPIRKRLLFGRTWTKPDEMDMRTFDFLSDFAKDINADGEIRQDIAWSFKSLVHSVLSKDEKADKRVLDFVNDRVNSRDDAEVRVAYIRALKGAMGRKDVSTLNKEEYITSITQHLFDEKEDMLLRKESIFVLYRIFMSEGVDVTRKKEIWESLTKIFLDKKEDIELRKEPAEVFEYILCAPEQKEHFGSGKALLENLLFDEGEDPKLRAHIGWVLRYMLEHNKITENKEWATKILERIRASSGYERLLGHVKVSKTGERRWF